MGCAMFGHYPSFFIVILHQENAAKVAFIFYACNIFHKIFQCFYQTCVFTQRMGKIIPNISVAIPSFPLKSVSLHRF